MARAVRLIAFLLYVQYALSLEASTPVKCTFEGDGKKFDLSSLSNAGADYIIQYDPLDSSKKIWVNMCRPTLQTLCGISASACQQWDPNNRNGNAELGDATTLSYSWGTQSSGQTGLIAKFTGGTPANGIPRSMQIDFTCSESAGAGMPSYSMEVNLNYFFTWTTSAACPEGGSGSGGLIGKTGLSGGSIFLIILLCCVVVYLVAGIIFKKVRMQAHGVEMIPNIDFWSSLPGLVRDGGIFLFRKIFRRGESAYAPVK